MQSRIAELVHHHVLMRYRRKERAHLCGTRRCSFQGDNSEMILKSGLSEESTHGVWSPTGALPDETLSHNMSNHSAVREFKVL